MAVDSTLETLEELLGSEDIESLLREEAAEVGIEVYKEADKSEEAKQLTVDVPTSARELAVMKKLVPQYYKDAIFDTERIQKAIEQDIKDHRGAYRIDRFDLYASTCNGIISTIRSGRVPDRSWIIGAPNGFGKTSFANECIMLMEEKNMRTAPYISLFELANVKLEEEKRLLNGFKYVSVKNQQGNKYTYLSDVEPYVKAPEVVTDKYSWSEYMNCECLFCYLTDVASRQIESRILYHILHVRGTKGLPTVVMMATSLQPYTSDKTLREQVWDEILGGEYGGRGFDRLEHVSCYKTQRNTLIDQM